MLGGAAKLSQMHHIQRFLLAVGITYQVDFYASIFAEDLQYWVNQQTVSVQQQEADNL
jgi:hypothetical protein